MPMLRNFRSIFHTPFGWFFALLVPLLLALPAEAMPPVLEDAALNAPRGELEPTEFETLADLNDPALPQPPYLKRFRRLAPGFYRGSQPTSLDLQFLKAQGIKTVISLIRSPRDLIEWEQEEATVQGLKFFSFPVHSYQGPTSQQVQAIFAEILRPENQPIFLHCKHGKDRTGMIAGLYRVHFQGWTPEAAYQEAKELGFNPWLLGLRNRFKHFMLHAPWETGLEPELLGSSASGASVLAGF